MSQGGAAATLELLCDGSPVVVEAADVTVGRTSNCTVRVVHPLVSREHCRLELRADGVWVVDLDSVNGTWVNDERASSRTRLLAGDRIGLGREGAVLVVTRAVVGGVDVSRASREEDVETMRAGDARAAGAVARIEVAAHAAPAEPPTRGVDERAGSAIPVVPALETTEVPRARSEEPPAAVAPPAAGSRGFVPGLAAGFAIGLAIVGALAKFTHVLDPLRPASEAAGRR